MRVSVCLALLALASACPSEWVNPCIIAGDDSYKLHPRDRQWCGSSGPGYIGRVTNANYINMHTASYQYSRRFYRNHNHNGDEIYLQECSNICFNHPDCTSFSWESRHSGYPHVSNPANWDDHARGDAGQTGDRQTAQTKWWTPMTGRCYLYKWCDVTKLQYHPLRKQWWLGTRDDGADGGRHGGVRRHEAHGRHRAGSTSVCTRKSAYDYHCKNDKTCISDCPSGQEIKYDATGGASCEPCPAGTFKIGQNAASCEAHQVCPKGQYEVKEGSASADTVCATHSPTCGNDSYETLSAISGNDGRDRECALCKICPAGTEIEQGCRKADPWADQMWNADSNGHATGAISVTQVVDITNKVIVVHGPDGKKVGCGKLIHNSAKNSDEATVTAMPGYKGAISVTGSFAFTQDATVVKGSYDLVGLPKNSKGMFHVHAGSSCDNVGGHYLNVEKADGHKHRRLLAAIAAGHPSTMGCQRNGNFPFFCDEKSAAAKSPKGTAHKMMSFWMPDDAPGMVMDASYKGNALQCADQCGSGNTLCAPCVPGLTFSASANSATCTPVTPCNVGEYVGTVGTATADQVCTPCTNKPPTNSFYTSASGDTVSNCEYKCEDGYILNNAGSECLAAGPTLRFKSQSGVTGRLVAFSNNVLSYQDFKCVDEPKFCGVQSTLRDMEKRLFALEEAVFRDQ